jgi:hypothetical protein
MLAKFVLGDQSESKFFEYGIRHCGDDIVGFVTYDQYVPVVTVAGIHPPVS